MYQPHQRTPTHVEVQCEEVQGDGAENILVQAVRSEAPIIDSSEKEQVLGSADELLPRENSDPAENRLGEADQPDHRLLAASAELCYPSQIAALSPKWHPARSDYH